MAEAAADTGAATPGAPTGSGTPAPAGPVGTTNGTGEAAPWHGQTDPAAVEYIRTKGWQAPADILKSYQGAEKLIGRDPSTLIPLPSADDPAGIRAVFSKLGMPETPDKYEIDKPGGEADPAYEAWARNTFHNLGLTAAQAKNLTKEYNAYAAQSQAEATKNYERQVQSDKAALLAEWRGGYERMASSAQTAVQALGFTGEMVDALESQIGYAGVMKFFAGIGQKLGEDSFVSTAGKGSGFGATQTPAEAKADWEAMKLDPVQSKALQDASHPGHEAAKAKQKQLFTIMYPA